jgi:Holliday junction resolvase RusA-like endonuclease
MRSVVEFAVPGIPQTKGSARAFPRGRRLIVVNDNASECAWANGVALFARAAMAGTPPFTGPVRLELEFRLARPAGHLGRAGAVKPSAPAFPGVRPDIDKLARSVADALTGIAYRDDGQITELVARKLYAGGGDEPGVRIRVAPIGAAAEASPRASGDAGVGDASSTAASDGVRHPLRLAR